MKKIYTLFFIGALFTHSAYAMDDNEVEAMWADNDKIPKHISVERNPVRHGVRIGIIGAVGLAASVWGESYLGGGVSAYLLVASALELMQEKTYITKYYPDGKFKARTIYGNRAKAQSVVNTLKAQVAAQRNTTITISDTTIAIR